MASKTTKTTSRKTSTSTSTQEQPYNFHRMLDVIAEENEYAVKDGVPYPANVMEIDAELAEIEDADLLDYYFDNKGVVNKYGSKPALAKWLNSIEDSDWFGEPGEDGMLPAGKPSLPMPTTKKTKTTQTAKAKPTQPKKEKPVVQKTKKNPTKKAPATKAKTTKTAKAKKPAREKVGVEHGTQRRYDLPWCAKKVKLFQLLKQCKAVGKNNGVNSKTLVEKSNGVLSARDVRHYSYHAQAGGLISVDEVSGTGRSYLYSLTAEGAKVDPKAELKKAKG